MGRLVSLIAILLAALSTVAAPAAVADIDIQPVGSVPIPAGPAEAWIVADMDTGQVLAGHQGRLDALLA